MWNCPKCNRNFKTANQSHMCSTMDIGLLFEGKPDELVIAFDDLVNITASWKPNTYGPSTKSIVFASEKAWLIVKPMKNELDLKFYNDYPLESGSLKKIAESYGKFAHHIRIKRPEELTQEVIDLLKIGHKFSLK